MFRTAPSECTMTAKHGLTHPLHRQLFPKCAHHNPSKLASRNASTYISSHEMIHTCNCYAYIANSC